MFIFCIFKFTYFRTFCILFCIFRVCIRIKSSPLCQALHGFSSYSLPRHWQELLVFKFVSESTNLKFNSKFKLLARMTVRAVVACAGRDGQ